MAARFRVAATPERDEALRYVGEIPESRSRSGAVPVNEDPSTTVTDEIPGGKVVVADQLLTIRRNRYLPHRIDWWNEVVQRVMQLANQLAQPM
jgi:hypothetical protein